MKDMQKIQPKMAALKEKFKDDRDAMNKAVMELYRDHKVNPLGGCLPMVVQIPVFFALYKALMFSIELRHAPFLLWVTDLSDKDPYYVTPVIMGITMFVQQKMTPSQMDPIQQKMMLALPVVFTFMFLSFPSGLVLYWLVNNVLTIGQQMYINKLVKD
jgi:YidC/Oxa1 family membrane protein insertase